MESEEAQGAPRKNTAEARGKEEGQGGGKAQEGKGGGGKGEGEKALGSEFTVTRVEAHRKEEEGG